MGSAEAQKKNFLFLKKLQLTRSNVAHAQRVLFVAAGVLAPRHQPVGKQRWAGQCEESGTRCTGCHCGARFAAAVTLPLLSAHGSSVHLFMTGRPSHCSSSCCSLSSGDFQKPAQTPCHTKKSHTKLLSRRLLEALQIATGTAHLWSGDSSNPATM